MFAVLTARQPGYPRAFAGTRRARTWWVVGSCVALALIISGCALSPLAAGGATSGGTTIPIKVIKGPDTATLIQVPVSIAGTGPYPFILDTGASETLIARTLAARLHLPRAGEQQSVTGVGGETVVIPVAIKSWRVGDAALPNATVASGTLPNDRGANEMQGLLGSDILSQFGKITIDYSAKTVTVYTRLAARPGSPGSVAGHAAARVPVNRSDWVIWRHAA